MGKPLSNDLRSRVVRAVAGGLTRRRAAAQFGVSAASAIRWVEAVRVSGTVEPKPQGGDTCSHRIEAFRGHSVGCHADNAIGEQDRNADRF